MYTVVYIIGYAYFRYITTDIFIMNLILMHREPEDGFILLCIALQYSFPQFLFFQITADPVNELIVMLSLNMSFNCSTLE